MADHKKIDEATGVETVGHEWDGIEELNNPLPRWWVLTFYACILFAIAYVVIYPAIPGRHKASDGLWKWSSRGALVSEVAAADKARGPVMAALAATPIEALPANPDLMEKAVAGGKAAFRVNCVQCHGAGAAGSKGYPNLNDDDWLWGGDLKTIETTITHGIRFAGDDQTRQSQMPSFGHDGILSPEQVGDVATYVRSLSGEEKHSAATQRGAAIFAANCAVCHGPEGKGGRQFGAPNLTDAIWLYGGDFASIAQTIRNGRNGQMPAQKAILGEDRARLAAAFVLSGQKAAK